MAILFLTLSRSCLINHSIVFILLDQKIYVFQTFNALFFNVIFSFAFVVVVMDGLISSR